MLLIMVLLRTLGSRPSAIVPGSKTAPLEFAAKRENCVWLFVPHHMTFSSITDSIETSKRSQRHTAYKSELMHLECFSSFGGMPETKACRRETLSLQRVCVLMGGRIELRQIICDSKGAGNYCPPSSGKNWLDSGDVMMRYSVRTTTKSFW